MAEKVKASLFIKRFQPPEGKAVKMLDVPLVEQMFGSKGSLALELFLERNARLTHKVISPTLTNEERATAEKEREEYSRKFKKISHLAAEDILKELEKE